VIIKDAETILPLSPLQEVLLAHEVGRSERGIMSEQWRCRLSGLLNVSGFEKAWQHVVSRHQLLRAFFVWKDLAKPVQVVHKQLTECLRQLKQTD
jgi:hypothetical protein